MSLISSNVKSTQADDETILHTGTQNSRLDMEDSERMHTAAEPPARVEGSIRLPVETWCEILAQDLLQAIDYYKLALVSQRVRQIAEPFLYARVCLDGPDRITLFIRRVGHQPELLKFLMSFTVIWWSDYRCSPEECRTVRKCILQKAVNLRDLTVYGHYFPDSLIRGCTFKLAKLHTDSGWFFKHAWKSISKHQTTLVELVADVKCSPHYRIRGDFEFKILSAPADMTRRLRSYANLTHLHVRHSERHYMNEQIPPALAKQLVSLRLDRHFGVQRSQHRLDDVFRGDELIVPNLRSLEVHDYHPHATRVHVNVRSCAIPESAVSLQRVAWIMERELSGRCCSENEFVMRRAATAVLMSLQHPEAEFVYMASDHEYVSCSRSLHERVVHLTEESWKEV